MDTTAEEFEWPQYETPHKLKHMFVSKLVTFNIPKYAIMNSCDVKNEECLINSYVRKVNIRFYLPEDLEPPEKKYKLKLADLIWLPTVAAIQAECGRYWFAPAPQEPEYVLRRITLTGLSSHEGIMREARQAANAAEAIRNAAGRNEEAIRNASGFMGDARRVVPAPAPQLPTSDPTGNLAEEPKITRSARKDKNP